MDPADQKAPKQDEQEKSAKHLAAIEKKKAKEAAKKAEKEARKKAKEEGKEVTGPSAAELAKQERLAKRQAEAGYKKDPNDPAAHLFGDLEICRSQTPVDKRYERVYSEIKDIDESKIDQEVWIRARVHGVRGQGQIAFVILRQQFYTIQSTATAGDVISKGMIKFLQKLHKESIVDVKAKVAAADVQSTSQKQELQILEFWTVNKSVPSLPFQIDDASVRVEDQTAEGQGQDDEEEKKEEKKEEEGEKKRSLVSQKQRLDHRIIDLRVPTNQAIFRLQSGVCQLFREYLYSQNFTEIHTPKTLGGSSEGGANVFTFKYFGQDACLAQSPQLYKQMALAADMERVFEIGPVFRAENSNTYRHLCEFTGLDMEMTFKQHYFEVLDVLGEMLVHIFNGLETRYAKELAVVNEQYPFEPFVCKTPIVKLHFKEGCQMLKEAGVEQDPLDDLSSETEKALGKLVKEKHGTDFYMLYGYPINARPFYTMPDPEDPNYTNSYDFFMRGEEITSGAQRIHDPELLAERATHHGIPLEGIQGYIDAFKYGISQHAGAGFGLERIVKFYCNLQNIRKASMFPRDPKRLAP